MKGKVTNQEIEAKMNNLQEQLESFGNALGGILLIQQEKKQEITPVQQKKVKDSWGYQKQNKQWKNEQKYIQLEKEMNEEVQQENEQEKPLENFSYDKSEVDRIARKYGGQQKETRTNPFEKRQEATVEATGIDSYREFKAFFLMLKNSNLPLAKKFVQEATGELLK